MSIYTDIADIENAINGVIENADEFNADVEAALSNLMQARQDTIVEGMERLAKVRVNKQANIAGIDAEIERLKARKERLNKTVDWLEGYIHNLLKASGEKKIEAGNFVVSTRKSQSLYLEADFNNPEYMRTKTTVEPDKMAIKAALKDGAVIEGAALTAKENISIK